MDLKESTQEVDDTLIKNIQQPLSSKEYQVKFRENVYYIR